MKRPGAPSGAPDAQKPRVGGGEVGPPSPRFAQQARHARPLPDRGADHPARARSRPQEDDVDHLIEEDQGNFGDDYDEEALALLLEDGEAGGASATRPPVVPAGRVRPAPARARASLGRVPPERMEGPPERPPPGPPRNPPHPRPHRPLPSPPPPTRSGRRRRGGGEELGPPRGPGGR